MAYKNGKATPAEAKHVYREQDMEHDECVSRRNHVHMCGKIPSPLSIYVGRPVVIDYSRY